MNWHQLLSAALDIGEQMHVSGGEIYRVEDCINRICRAYGAIDVDVFTITSSIVLTIQAPDGKRYTQTRRIERAETNLDRVDKLNRLSRQMCQQQLPYDTFVGRFSEIMSVPRYPQWLEYVAYAMIAGCFTVFSGGTLLDALISALIGLGLKAVVTLNGNLRFNRVLSSVIASFVLSSLAFISVGLLRDTSVNTIVIGNIMLLIPGVGLTNSMRDMISGDTMSGILRFIEACIVALAIAGGYMLAGSMLGGVLWL